MAQSKVRSLKEAWVNIAIGFGINYIANLLILPLFGFNISLTDNVILGVFFTVISVCRQYIVRRWFNRGD